MIIGSHTLLFTSNPDADRSFFRDVLGLSNVDAGQGFLIFGLPPSELAVHESESNGTHEMYLMCEDVEVFVSSMRERDVEVSDPEDQGWGIVTQLRLPGGGRMGVYQPCHPRPEVATLETAAPKKKRAAKKKVAKAKPAKAKPAKKKVAKKKAAKKKKR